MLTGRNAKNYRVTLSGVSVDELAEFIDIHTINRVEDDFGEPVDNDTVTQYYRAVNRIKQNKSRKIIDIPEGEPDATAGDTPTEDAVTEVKPKTRKPRQPKTKA